MSYHFKTLIVDGVFLGVDAYCGVSRYAFLTAEELAHSALEYSNAADDLQLAACALSEVVVEIVERQGFNGAPNQLATLARTGDRVAANVIAAFICWASGGMYALQKKDPQE